MISRVNQRFRRVAVAKARSFGEDIAFDFDGNPRIIRAIFRLFDDPVLQEVGGNGAVSQSAVLTVPTHFSSHLAKGIQFTSGGKRYRISDNGLDDGRGMMRFDCERIDHES